MPIVNNVGGLHDTVRDIHDTDKSICGQGIKFSTLNSDTLLRSVTNVLQLFTFTKRFLEITRANMHCNVSFEKSAATYLKLYHEC